MSVINEHNLKICLKVLSKCLEKNKHKIYDIIYQGHGLFEINSCKLNKKECIIILRIVGHNYEENYDTIEYNEKFLFNFKNLTRKEIKNLLIVAKLNINKFISYFEIFNNNDTDFVLKLKKDLLE